MSKMKRIDKRKNADRHGDEYLLNRNISRDQKGRWNDRFETQEALYAYKEAQCMRAQQRRDKKKAEECKIELSSLKKSVGKAKITHKPNGAMIIELPEMSIMQKEIIKYNENGLNVLELSPHKVISTYMAITTAKDKIMSTESIHNSSSDRRVTKSTLRTVMDANLSPVAVVMYTDDELSEKNEKVARKFVKSTYFNANNVCLQLITNPNMIALFLPFHCLFTDLLDLVSQWFDCLFVFISFRNYFSLCY